MKSRPIKLQNHIPFAWRDAVQGLVSTEVWNNLNAEVSAARSYGQCYPPEGMEWNALLSVPPEEVKVIICGQDPYHGSGQAHGLAFSVMQGQAHPPSLRNVLKELANDLEPNAEPKGHGSAVGALQHWSDQGVLLLNDVLTVSEGRPGSHQGIGWEQVTQAILEVVLMQNTPLVLMLWGASARKKNAQLRGGDYLILETSHPSPLSAYRGFLGSKPFSRANAWLESRGLSSIQW